MAGRPLTFPIQQNNLDRLDRELRRETVWRDGWAGYQHYTTTPALDRRRFQKPTWRRWHLCCTDAQCCSQVERNHDLIVSFLEVHEAQYRGWNPFRGYAEILKLAIEWERGCAFCGELKHPAPCRERSDIGRRGCRHSKSELDQLDSQRRIGAHCVLRGSDRPKPYTYAEWFANAVSGWL